MAVSTLRWYNPSFLNQSLRSCKLHTSHRCRHRSEVDYIDHTLYTDHAIRGDAWHCLVIRIHRVKPVPTRRHNELAADRRSRRLFRRNVILLQTTVRLLLLLLLHWSNAVIVVSFSLFLRTKSNTIELITGSVTKLGVTHSGLTETTTTV